jgi:hypothetical protein
MLRGGGSPCRRGAAVAALVALAVCLQPSRAAVAWSAAAAVAEGAGTELPDRLGDGFLSPTSPPLLLVDEQGRFVGDFEAENVSALDATSDRRLLLARRSSRFRRQLLAEPRHLQASTKCGDSTFTMQSGWAYAMSCSGSGDKIDLPCSFNMGNDQTGDKYVPALACAAARLLLLLLLLGGWWGSFVLDGAPIRPSARRRTQLSLGCPASCCLPPPRRRSCPVFFRTRACRESDVTGRGRQPFPPCSLCCAPQDLLANRLCAVHQSVG